jgi:hypothetical protein
MSQFDERLSVQGQQEDLFARGGNAQVAFSERPARVGTE